MAESMHNNTELLREAQIQEYKSLLSKKRPPPTGPDGKSFPKRGFSLYEEQLSIEEKQNAVSKAIQEALTERDFVNTDELKQIMVNAEIGGVQKEFLKDDPAVQEALKEAMIRRYNSAHGGAVIARDLADKVPTNGEILKDPGFLAARKENAARYFRGPKMREDVERSFIELERLTDPEVAQAKEDAKRNIV